MRELSLQEIESVNGGNPLPGLFWGVVGSYAYDAVGGYDGINSYFASIGNDIWSGGAYQNTWGFYNAYS